MFAEYFKRLKFPLLMSGLLFGISILSFQKIDLYAVVISCGYLVLGTISSVGSYYQNSTQQPETTKTLFKMLIEPPAIFLFLFGLFYIYGGEFYWIFISITVFLTFVIFVILFSDWTQAREKSKKEISE